MRCRAAWRDADLVFGFGSAAGAGLDPGRRAGAAGRRSRTASTSSTAWCRPSSQAARPGDHMLVMSNGGFGGVHQKLLDALARVNADAGADMILYLHGFRSSPQSFKARVIGERMAAARARRRTDLPAAAGLARRRRSRWRTALIDAHAAGRAGASIGSSLGGFYATWLAEQPRLPRGAAEPGGRAAARIWRSMSASPPPGTRTSRSSSSANTSTNCARWRCRASPGPSAISWSPPPATKCSTTATWSRTTPARARQRDRKAATMDLSDFASMWTRCWRSAWLTARR